MSKIVFLIAAVCLALPAADGPEACHGKLREQAIQRFDSDHDGKMSDSERAAAKEAMQNRVNEARQQFDADHDGKLSDAERAAARAALAARLKQNHPDLFARIDSDHDGQLSKEEMEAARAKLRALRAHHGGNGDRPAAD